MEVLKIQDAERRDVGTEAVGLDARGLDGLVSQEPAVPFQGCVGVPLPLHHKVQHLMPLELDWLGQPLAPQGL
jgi:hypothetical protein